MSTRGQPRQATGLQEEAPAQTPGSVVGKRTQRDENLPGSNKKPLLNEAFHALRIGRQDGGEADDVDMRDPATFDKDAHTVVVQSLEDALREIREEEQSREPGYIFTLPEPIDRMFAGRRALPLAPEVQHRLEVASSPEASQMVLYKGRAEDVISKRLQEARDLNPDEVMVTEVANDMMELD